MIYISNQTYKPKRLFKNKHFNTVFRHFFSKTQLNYERERMFTNDGDFIDLDFSKVNADTLIIAIHGLEGSSNSTYIKTLGKVVNNNKFDFVALNLRGCSGEPNNLLSSYHSGKSDDLKEVISYLNKKHNYKNIHVVGYSLGGNITLKYMGESGLETNIKSVVTISVPCSLKGSSIAISNKGSKMYMRNFLKTLSVKAKEKIIRFDLKNIDYTAIKKAKNFKDFDNHFTAPTHGFKNAEDYWQKSSCNRFLEFIKKPSLLITALDDPFLNKDCYPIKKAENSNYFHLLTTKYGGHVGFNQSFNSKKNFWLENEILIFIKNNNKS